MKKILCVLLISGISTFSFSQFIKKGSVIGGGSFDFQTAKYKDSDLKSFSISLLPWAGYLVIDNLVVGGNLEFQNSGSKSSTSNYKSNSNSIGIGPIVRYYLKEGIFFHGQNNFGSAKITQNFTGSETVTKIKSSNLRLGVGYAARIGNNVFFEPVIGYYNNWNSELIYDSSGLFIMGGFTIILKTVQ